MIEPSVQVALVSAGGTVTVALVGVLVELVRRQGQALSEVREHTEEARHQVANTHSTNLRDDVDRVLDGMEQLLAGQLRHDEALGRHGDEINALRREMAHERVERLAVAERLDNHLSAN
ncbi:hypothetical protein GCM10010211_48980 [Streptomyces albospinus]|uniref:DUF2746 domain-containing protein n=2 Tax=Streptomyces TaxID=1883 RepID=A0A101PBV2_9ACTN|nr:DUF2746 domain-containing protein [Streptomyces yokosukanensis]KUN08582.1 hypothetical protein AQI95_09510 [Streptomyces yokosukanensis]GGU77262.1 hypothetical protein GCM10010211_48980 [Streptomyces albospinus]